MASLTPEKPSGKYTLKASKNRGHRNDLTDLDEFVKNGVLRSKHGRDRPDHVSTLMELARDGPLEDFMTACGQLKDSSDNSGNSTYVNLNRAVALNDVNFEDQREALRKLYGAGEKEIGKIFRDIKEMQFNDEDRNWRTKNIREKSRVGNKAERLPVMWNARAVIYPGAVAAFATAGFLILPPGKSHRKVIATTVVGGFVCLFCLLSFLRKIFKSLGLLFLILDLAAQQKLEKYTVNAVKMMLGKPLVDILENRYKAWYKACYTAPVNKFFDTEDSDLFDDIPSITSGDSLVELTASVGTS
ncbi:unnamed protein product [Sphagnum tenellum]